VKAPEDLYLVGSRPQHLRTSWNYPDYRAMRDQNTVFEGLAGYSLGLQTMGVQLGGGVAQASELAYGVLVSGNYFDVLGVSPAIGRVFDSSDDRAPGAAPYVVLSYTYWQRRFRREATVVGRKLRLNGYPFTVIGVAPPGFTGTDVAFKPDLFIPIMMRSQITHVSFERWSNRHNWWMAAIGRLKPGTPIKKAEGQLFAICKDQEAAERRSTPNPKNVNTAEQTVLGPGGRGYSWIADELRKPLWVLFAIVALVLLIACANVANLMLARGATRQREIAVRLAVGAGRWRVASQLLTESLLIAFAGGAAGVVVSLLGVRLLLRFAPQPAWTPVAIHASPDWRVLAFTVAVSLATGLLFGVAPALRSSNPDLVSALKEDVPGSTGIHRFGLRKTLVVVQVALSLLLLIGASLFVRTLGSLRSLDTGFARENVIIASVDPARFGYKGQRLRDFYERLRARLAVSPGVRSASLANITPLSGSSWNSNVAIEGYAWKPGEKKYVWFDAVGSPLF
jgi:predicted permease